ncbi:zinc-binding dehydrogenase [Seleniivibrio sp.]|uniref:zinc-binding dehydrogenase n=1 Tax=Seleniivibrio sp. TaxID=2898801 RepID=UPI0025FBA0F7|nr:zinc-binding dehydrogenase [Seleniivibrio sp.]MCD8554281.1 zinc-binding dehydrogenase [Seleniivibrio sp.]
MQVKTTKAAILKELNSPLIIDEITLPENLAYGQVLVRIHYSSICGSQLGEISGVKGHDPYLPHMLGHEGSGVVLEVGEGVSMVKPGDRVVMHWKPSNGINAKPANYTWRGAKLNSGQITTFSEHAVVSENRLTPIPDDFDMKIAPLFGCAVTTGLGVIKNDAQVKIGDSVIIFGAGGVGLNMIQGAVMSGAYPVIATDIHKNRLEMAKKMGATVCLLADDKEGLEAAMKQYSIKGFDIAIDNTGNPAVIAQAYGITSPEGRTVLVGVPKKGNNTELYTLPLHFGKSITGSHGGGTIPQKDIPAYIRLYKAGRLDLDRLITHTFKLDDINTALDMMRKGETDGRCLLEMI